MLIVALPWILFALDFVLLKLDRVGIVVDRLNLVRSECSEMGFVVVCCGWLGSRADEGSGVRSVEFFMVMVS